jgi:hypothetical protein
MNQPWRGPYPNPAFRGQVSMHGEAPLTAVISGEITVGRDVSPLGSPRMAGRVADAYLSIFQSGKDDSNALALELDVKINNTSVFSTKPKIRHVSGESSTQKSTKVSGEAGCTSAIIDTDNNSYSPGDFFTYELTLTRTASPTTEMANAAIVVELEPDVI